jgi:hypothetical protein
MATTPVLLYHTTITIQIIIVSGVVHIIRHSTESTDLTQICSRRQQHMTRDHDMLQLKHWQVEVAYDQ